MSKIPKFLLVYVFSGEAAFFSLEWRGGKQSGDLIVYLNAVSSLTNNPVAGKIWNICHACYKSDLHSLFMDSVLISFISDVQHHLLPVILL